MLSHFEEEGNAHDVNWSGGELISHSTIGWMYLKHFTVMLVQFIIAAHGFVEKGGGTTHPKTPQPQCVCVCGLGMRLNNMALK